MKFYLAASYARRREMQGIAAALEAFGHQVTSRWVRRLIGVLFASEPRALQEHWDYSRLCLCGGCRRRIFAGWHEAK